jgi:hypothetical protein
MRQLISLIFCVCLWVTSSHASAPIRKFDEFYFRDCESLIARLDNFAVAVNDNHQAVGLVYVYGGKVTRKGDGQMHMDVIRNYLIERRQVDGRRLRVLWGGYQEKAGAEIWIAPPGAAQPDPSPTIDQKDVLFAKQWVKRNAFRCARRPWK